MRFLRALSLLLPSAGLCIAGYLYVNKLFGLDASCVGGSGCSEVAMWVDKHMAGFPVALLGILGYMVLLVIGFKGLKDREEAAALGFKVSAIGVVISALLMALAFFVIKATCWWCIGSALAMLATFGTYALIKVNTSTEKSDGLDRIIGAFGVIVFVLAMLWSGFEAFNKLPPPAKGTIDDYVPANPKMYGNKDAPITIVEFFSFSCAHCRESYPHVKSLIDASNGQARLVMVHFPFLNREDHAMAAPAAAASEMAHEKGKFFEFADEIYKIDTKALNPDHIAEAAAKVGLDPEAVRKRMQNDKDPAIERITSDLKISSELGIQITPTYLVGRKGTRVDVLLNKTFIPTLTGVRYGLPKPSDME